MSQIIEPFLNMIHRIVFFFFNEKSHRIELFCKYDTKLNLFFSFWIWLKELNLLFEYDSEKFNLFLIYMKELNFLKYDSKNWIFSLERDGTWVRMVAGWWGLVLGLAPCWISDDATDCRRVDALWLNVRMWSSLVRIISREEKKVSSVRSTITVWFEVDFFSHVLTFCFKASRAARGPVAAHDSHGGHGAYALADSAVSLPCGEQGSFRSFSIV